MAASRFHTERCSAASLGEEDLVWIYFTIANEANPELAEVYTSSCNVSRSTFPSCVVDHPQGPRDPESLCLIWFHYSGEKADVPAAEDLESTTLTGSRGIFSRSLDAVIGF